MESLKEAMGKLLEEFLDASLQKYLLKVLKETLEDVNGLMNGDRFVL